MMAPAADFFKKYQARAPKLGIDPLGYYLGGWGYAYLQVLPQAIEGTKSIEDDKIANYLHGNAVNTIMAEASGSAKTANGSRLTSCRCSITASPTPRTSKHGAG